MKFPDFVTIGAMKCATSTLHEQLGRQPNIFMSEPKEPNFFSNDEEYAKGIGWYEGLFAEAPAGALLGESSTHYTKLPTYPETIDRLARHAPEAKFIYIIRHPVERLVSQYIHEWTQRLTSKPINEAVLELPILTDYSRYAYQLRPWLERFGQERILLVYFESLSARPQCELERVCRFIGYEGAPQWDFQLEADNVSSQRLRKSPVRDAIINAPLIRTVRKNLIPRTVRDRIKAYWSMKTRPEMSAELRGLLTETFDLDLADLGRWIGQPLSCATFKETAMGAPPEWKSAPRKVLR